MTRAFIAAATMALSAVFAGPARADAGLPARESGAVDYEAAFGRMFPALAGEHHVLDWTLYSALVGGDVVAYATRIDPAFARQIEETKGKGYQTQELANGARLDKRLIAAFGDQRRRLGSMVLYANGDGVVSRACRHPLVFIDKEFRLVLDENARGRDPLASARVAPSCPQTLEPGLQITAGRSPRLKCWADDRNTMCGWRLPDMPVDLKRIIENEYPDSIKARWRWRGLGAVVRIRDRDSNGNRAAERDSVTVTIPGDLALEFVDARGRVLWTAAATGPSRASPARRGP